MANPSSKKRKNQSSDKRIKAKVGKRALKPANETNTETKFSTINVSQQNVARSVEENAATADGHDVQELLSTRGRSLDETVASLRHPASAVRISAARGLKDAVTRQQASAGVIRSHLAVLMPVCGKCIVDEDSEVRQLALEVLREILTSVCSGDPEGQGYLKPFMPLLMAHVTSALNSLDRKTALFGTSTVEMMCSIVPFLISPFTSEFLPAYTVILSHRASSQVRKADPTASNDAKKQARAKNSTTAQSPRYQVLKSLLALLKAGSSRRPSGSTAKSDASKTTDLEIKNDGRGISSLFIPGPTPRTIPALPLCNLRDMPSFLQLNTAVSRNSNAVNGNRIPLTPETTCDLLGKLRDAFAEATQSEQEQQDLQEVLLILESAHLFYNASCRSSGVSGEANRKDPLVKVWCQYASLMMSTFPMSEALFPASLMAEINLKICTTVLDTHLDGVAAETEHLDQVLAYLFGELERRRPSPSSANQKENKANNINSDDTLFAALEKLLMISSQQKDVEAAAGKTIYRKLVRSVANSFFSEETTQEEPEVIDAIACSATTRKGALLAKKIFSQRGWSVQVEDSKSFGAVLFQILQGLATFLGSWGSEYPFETEAVVGLLHTVVLRLDVTSEELSSEESSLVDHTRASLLPLLKHSKKRSSVFERFTKKLQRKLIGLVVILQAPTQGTLDGFGKICARCWVSSVADSVSPDVASYIVQSMHAIRRTIPMHSFLGFVINSTGLTQKPFGKGRQAENIGVSDVLAFDASVELVRHTLSQCGPAKVLPLVQPLLEQWLSMEPNSVPTADKVLTARATISILACCLSSFEDISVILRDVAPKLEKPTLTAMVCILKHFSSLESSGGGQGLEEQELAAFLEPLILLFQREDRLFRSCYRDLSMGIEDLQISEATSLLSALTMMTNDGRLSGSLKGSTELVDCTMSIEKALSSTSLDRAAGILRASMDVKCGGTREMHEARS